MSTPREGTGPHFGLSERTPRGAAADTAALAVLAPRLACRFTGNKALDRRGTVRPRRRRAEILAGFAHTSPGSER